MDSSAYSYCAADILSRIPEKYRAPLPCQFIEQSISLSDQSLTAVADFLNQILDSSDTSTFFSRPVLLCLSETNFFTVLFRTVHEQLSENLQMNPFSNPDRNAMELVRFLSHAISTKWLPVFAEKDIVSCAMCCFLLEACMHCGWCPSAFENNAKRAAHLYFSLMKKNLFRAAETDLATILGYLQSARLCAQSTEGIADETEQPEKKPLNHRYSWYIHTETMTAHKECIMYRDSGAGNCMILTSAHNRCAHPLYHIVNDGQVGMRLYQGSEQIHPSELIEQTPIRRPNHTGEKFVYRCKTPYVNLTWTVVIQIFKNTTYRIDILGTESQPCTLSDVELRLENGIALTRDSANRYHGTASSRFIVEFIRNDFVLEYIGQQPQNLSLFKAKPLILHPSKKKEMITAWSCGKDVTSIDQTHLLGIFDV